MPFLALEFLVAVPAVVAAYWALREWRLAWLALASLALYGWWSPTGLAVLAASAALNLALARAMARPEPAARALLGTGVAANLALLAGFRAGWLGEPPPGLMLATVVQLAFLADAWRARAAPPATAYAAFATFFPRLPAGPVVRWDGLGRQLAAVPGRAPDWDAMALGVAFIAIGLAKKTLLADALAAPVDAVFEAARTGAPLTAAAAWGGALGFGVQFGLDLSALTDIAIGLGLLFGVRLPENFAQPGRATSAIEFWRRFHVSLGTALRDLVYRPLGGSRRGAGRQALALFATMLACGLLHGPGWTFAVWGALMGAMLAANHAWRRLRAVPGTAAGRIAAWVLTLAALAVGWAWFRAATPEAALALLRAMAFAAPSVAMDAAAANADGALVRLGLVSEERLLALFAGTWSFTATATLLGLLALGLVLPETAAILGYRADGSARAPPRTLGIAWPRWRPDWPRLALVGVLLAVVLVRAERMRPFLYLRF